MTITLELLPDTQRKLETLATKSGQDVPGFVQGLIEEKIQNTNGANPYAGMTLDEVAAPLREDFKASGMTEVEFDALIEEVREEVWQEKHAGSKAS